MNASLLGQKIQLKIEKLAIGGNGLGRFQGLVVFVPFSAPGDELLVQIVEQKSKHATGEIVEILSPSPHRIEPPCPYYFQCGGCNWQHLNHQFQLQQKHSLVEETLRKFLRREIPAEPILASPRSWRYRNRIQVSIDKGHLGFKKRKTHQVIDIKDCLITEDGITQFLNQVRSEAADSNRLEIYLDENETPHWKAIGATSDGIGFSQVNRFQNEDLIRAVLASIETEPQQILELYAGSGNFTWPLAEAFPKSQVTAVELNPVLVERALLKKKSFSKLRFLSADVEIFLRQHTLHENLVFLDPPRQGTSPFVMKTLGCGKARQILYLSCHPVSLARDLDILLRESVAAGRPFEIHKVQPFEMFPQTDHIETLVDLRRTL